MLQKKEERKRERMPNGVHQFQIRFLFHGMAWHGIAWHVAYTDGCRTVQYSTVQCSTVLTEVCNRNFHDVSENRIFLVHIYHY